MKFSSGLLGLALSFAMVHGGLAAKEPSKLSAFAGKYSGSVVYGGQISGTTTATFSASKKKDVGTLNLTSTIIFGSNVYTLLETFQINKRSLSYSLAIAGTGGAGTGTATVGKKNISYSGTFAIGDQAYGVTGTIKKSGKRGLAISELITGSPSFPISYSLSRKGK